MMMMMMAMIMERTVLMMTLAMTNAVKATLLMN